jgi:hypothetical protein
VTLLYDVRQDGSPEVGKTLPIIRTKAVADNTPLVAAKTKVVASRKLPPITPKPVETQNNGSKYYHPKLSVTKFCSVCFKPFSAKRKDATICSPQCRMKAMRENKQLRMI